MLPLTFLITDLHLGGSPLMLRTLAIGLKNTGTYQISVISLAPFPPSAPATNRQSLIPQSSIPDQLRAASIPTYSLDAAGPLDLRALPRLIRLLKHLRPQILYSILIHANALATAAQPFLPKIIYIQSIHTVQPRPRWHWTLQARLTPRANALIVPSPVILKKMEEKGRLPSPDHTAVIPNGIDINRFHLAPTLPLSDLLPMAPSAPKLPADNPSTIHQRPLNDPPPTRQEGGQPESEIAVEVGQEREKTGEIMEQNLHKLGQNRGKSGAIPGQNGGKTGAKTPFILGYVGRFDPIKRLPLLLQALAQLQKSPSHSLQSAATHLILVGYGEQEKYLKTLADSLHIAPLVHFPGPTSTPEKWYKAFDLFCLPSEAEGFPLSLLEAMAAGTPVLAADIPAVRQAITPGLTGTLVSNPTPDTLAAAIALLMNDPPHRLAHAQAAFLHVSERFTEEQMISLHDNFIKKFAKP